ncbi:sterol desaturase family protein [Niabella yanshanensis]|uniref:Sterol desaturase family protein n=1 Tax=Niabella yanshanensis TaxID=577386 RepID=A0ABZ0WAE0_9BACT|nr:sterol desaturase family protein [Niabella yanshanensis]WQD40253.1 sterol desaturase family protein [Niabella yanshanensis]
MHLNFLAFAIPLFLFFIACEYLYSKRSGKNFFQYAESVANINVGIAERLLDLFTTGLFFYFFTYVYKNFALFDIKENFLVWVLLFLVTDFIWYWYHRLAHEINAFWAAHVVHHQSEDFNYTVSARITVFQAVIRSLFWAVLPLLGFPPLMISILLLVHGIYPFFIHTQALGKWGWFEKILVTPTHHGIHHASNPEYLDKNYGDVLIIWDKLFGTFVEENKNIKITYGLTKPLESHSFLWQHFHFVLEILLNFYHAKGFKQKWRTLFGKPDDLDSRYRDILERKFLRHRRTKETPTKAMRYYVSIQTGISLLVLFIVLLFEQYFSAKSLTLFSLFIIISLINCGAILDQRRWISYLEIARVCLVLFILYYYQPSSYTATLFVSTIMIGIIYFSDIQRFYTRILYSRSES